MFVLSEYILANSTKIAIGDCFRMPLPNLSWGYCQYIAWSDSDGYLIRVLDLFTQTEEVHEAELSNAEALFPPVFVGLKASVRSGRWKKVGNFAIPKLQFPQFRMSSRGTKPGVYEDWWLWDGSQETRIGRLPENLQKLELRQVWGDEGLEQRVVDGNYRGDLMF